jgi:putative transposase
MTLPLTINQRWSLDFVSDTLSDGWRFRILCIVDDFSRECLATVVDTSLGGVRVVRELDPLTRARATPNVIVSDKGTAHTESGGDAIGSSDNCCWLHGCGQPLAVIFMTSFG